MGRRRKRRRRTTTTTTRRFDLGCMGSIRMVGGFCIRNSCRQLMQRDSEQFLFFWGFVLWFASSSTEQLSASSSLMLEEELLLYNC
jgi:hypothetical protein